MSVLKETLAKIGDIDHRTAEAVKARLEAGGAAFAQVGRLKDLVVQYAGITGQAEPALPKSCMVIACADHGVARQTVSAYPIETTAQMTRNYVCSRGASANALANFCGSEMVVADVGVAADLAEVPGLWHRKIAYGTNDFTQGPAMTRQQAVQALETGIEIVTDRVKAGITCFSLGEMGIGNTTASAAIVSLFTGISPRQATGRGTGISDERLVVKIGLVEKALAVNRPDAADGLDVLIKIGGFELGTLAGVILGAAANHCMVVIDGLNTTAAALLACAIAPDSRKYLAPSHLSGEPAHIVALRFLGLTAMLDLGIRLGEAVGASFVIHMLGFSVKLLQGKLQEEHGTSWFTKNTQNLLAGPLPPTVQPLNRQAMDRCQLRIDNLTKPLGCLHALEHLACKLAGITGQPRPPRMLKRSILLLQERGRAGDCGLTAACIAAEHVGANLVMVETNPASGCVTESDLRRAITQGSSLAAAQTAAGARIIGIGTLQTAEVAAALAVIAYCTAADIDTLTPEELPPGVAGRAKQLYHTLQERKLPQDPVALLAAVGSREMGIMLGIILGSVAGKAAVVLDGVITAAAALLAARMVPAVQAYLVGAHYCKLLAQKTALAELEVPAYLYLDIGFHEGVGAALGIGILDAALHMLNDMKTFGEADVAVAQDGIGAGRQDKNVRD
ncbi:hypothetical protein P22_2628 [Propionispora sp. 2/2-37]|uniref:nicotinate-nucleotide--dimethylbenzimidazole phosphoribosyltransferase n=1 Tax=Propionispora sp. 2/2-37 TaxID=1677858 RepID=UPI0006C5630D|nr:nicotinate-nucleotide--dimethylbenzimidazole phosphoribosyltransferase [Propionispora sp. 2/2-37]CUH96538.1 hypothetical protein P22_2628 [Propionispora sp. 2/2-37]